MNSAPADAVASATAKAPTPLLLITGFLGSGKTTLINRWLALSGQPRLGVVVNEFGQIGIDGTLLAGARDDAGTFIMELANGCVCCVRGTEMWESALELVDRAGAEVLLVETSGMVEPRVLLEQYRLLPPALARRIELRGILCVVDALGARQAVAQRSEAVHQIEFADRLLITKLDLAQPEQLMDTHRLLDGLSASSERASLHRGAKADEVASVLRWALHAPPRRRAAAQAEPEGGASPTDGDRDHRHGKGSGQLVVVSLHEPEPLLAAPLLQLLRELRGKVLRAKGIVRVLGAPFAEDSETSGASVTPTLAALHLAGAQVELQALGPGSEAAAAGQPGSTLVFIGEDLDENWLRLRVSACRSRIAPPMPTEHAAPST
jgi:G3E family GTPase